MPQAVRVRTGTIFEQSYILLKKWLYAMHLPQTAGKRVSSLKLAQEPGITQKSAWFLLKRLREALDVEAVDAVGEVEVDESFLGGMGANRYADKRLRVGCGKVGKEAVLGMPNLQGRMAANPTDDSTAPTVQQEITDSVLEGATLHSDGHSAYDGCENL